MFRFNLDKLWWIRWLAIALLAWTLLAAIPTSSAYLAAGSGGLGQWLLFFSYIGPYYYLWALASIGIFLLATGPLHPRHGLARSLAGHLLTCFVLSVVLGSMIHHQNIHKWLLGENAPGYYAMSFFSYVFILVGVYLFHLQAKVREQERIIASQLQRELELKSSLAQSQLEALRGQMNPHFLFNALNCIGALIETRQNDLAYQALEDLGELLRTSLEHRKRPFIPLVDELAFTRRYVAIERVRFGDRLQVAYDIEPTVLPLEVPPFVLQPLIENAIKHAVAPNRDSVSVLISAHSLENEIELSVADSGTARGSISPGTGLGLSNLRQRLHLCYGVEGRLEFHQDNRGTRVVLHMPMQPDNAPQEKPAAEKEPDVTGVLHVQH